VPGFLVFLFIIERIKPALAQLHIQDNFGVSAQHDIGTTASHVGSNRNVAGATRTRNDIAFFFVVLRVEHIVLHAPLGQKLRQVFRAFHRGGTNQNWLPPLHVFGNVIHNGSKLGFLRLIDAVREVLTLVRTVSWDRNKVQIVTISQTYSLIIDLSSSASVYAVPYIPAIFS